MGLANMSWLKLTLKSTATPLFRSTIRWSSSTAKKGFANDSLPEDWKIIDNKQHFGNDKIRIKNERFLAGSFAETFPETVSVPSGTVPVTLAYSRSGKETAINHEVSQMAEGISQFVENCLEAVGAVLIKGVPLPRTDDFAAFYDGFGYGKSDYIGGIAVREPDNNRIFSASLEPPDLHIEPHNEMSYLKEFPDKITFYCETPAAQRCGGQTAIVRNQDIQNDLNPEFMTKVAEKKLRYVQTLYPDGGSKFLCWRDVFDTKERKVVEKELKRRNCNWEWLENDKLCFSYLSDGFFQHPKTMKKIWFNQASAAHYSYFVHHPLYEGMANLSTECPFHCQYGDGSEIEDQFIQNIREVAWKHAVAIPWEQGDVLILNNLMVQHSRLAFKGERKLRVAISNKMHCR